MRVAVFVWQFPILSETFILNQITGLIDRGHEVDIYAHQVGDKDKVHPDVEKYRLLERTYYVPEVSNNLLLRLLKGVKLLLNNGYKKPLVLLRSLNLFKYGKQAASLCLLYEVIPFIGKEKYDIIHCQFGTEGLRGMLLRKLGAIEGKLITTFRGFDISWYIQEYGEKYYNELFQAGDFFLTNCDFFKRRIVKLGCDEKKVVVLYSGIDCQRFFFRPRCLQLDGKVRIAFTGRLVEKKGIEYSIRAVAKVVKSHPNIEYNIVGEGDLRADLQQLINQLGVSHIVHLVGQKNQQELVEILNNSQIFIAPSVTAKDGNQDAPINVLKEAMAMGLPVVSTAHGGIPELVEDGISGFLVPERDADALAEKLSYLIEHPEVWLTMGEAGRAYVEKHFDINKLNDDLVAIYQQVLNLDNSPQQPQTQTANYLPT